MKKTYQPEALSAFILKTVWGRCALKQLSMNLRRWIADQPLTTCCLMGGEGATQSRALALPDVSQEPYWQSHLDLKSCSCLFQKPCIKHIQYTLRMYIAIMCSKYACVCVCVGVGVCVCVCG